MASWWAGAGGRLHAQRAHLVNDVGHHGLAPLGEVRQLLQSEEVSELVVVSSVA